MTGSSGKFAISHAPYQLKISLFNRLIGEGMPHTQLTKQGRMHECLAAIPNKYVYDGKLETADHRKGSLEQDIPGCDVVTKLRDLYRSVGAQRIDDRTEQSLRLQGFQIDGTVQTNDKTGSKVNLEHVNFVVEKIVPALPAVDGDQTINKCKIIIGYFEAVDRINEALQKNRNDNKDIAANIMPIVQTMDSSQGTQAEWVCFISVVHSGQKLSNLAFQKDNKCLNVALTRALHILTVIHGVLEGGKSFDDASLDWRYLYRSVGKNHPMELILISGLSVALRGTALTWSASMSVKLATAAREMLS